jgi:hypothetical protein
MLRQPNFSLLIQKILREHARATDDQSKAINFIERVADLEPSLLKASGTAIFPLIEEQVQQFFENPPTRLPTKGSRMWMCVLYLSIVRGLSWSSDSELRALILEK